MSSNSAYFGGAAHADGDSIVTATHCTMTSNSAYLVGGAVYAGGDSTLTALDCEMTSNRAAEQAHSRFTKPIMSPYV